MQRRNQRTSQEPIAIGCTAEAVYVAAMVASGGGDQASDPELCVGGRDRKKELHYFFKRTILLQQEDGRQTKRCKRLDATYIVCVCIPEQGTKEPCHILAFAGVNKILLKSNK